MRTTELYLKTAFCCMACDGSIADEEVTMLKQYVDSNKETFQDAEIETLLNAYVSEINEKGVSFLKSYLSDLADTDISEEEQLGLIKLAISIIESDNKIEYSEVAFFKKIRLNLSISDDVILSSLPDKGDYLLPDIIDDSPFEWLPVSFNNITIC